MKVTLAVRPLPVTNPDVTPIRQLAQFGTAMCWLGARYLCHRPIRKPIDRSNFSSHNLLKRRDE
jgi:hypothetical protein